MAVTINEGTQTDILTTLVGGTETQIVRLDVGTGTAASNWGGTVFNSYTGVTSATNGAYTATTTTGTLLASNTSRKFALISNDGTADVYLGFATTAAINSGYRLNANGGAMELTGPSLYTGVISAITSAGSSVVCKIEG